MFCRTIFEEYRAHLHIFFPEGVEPVPWAFDPRVVFERKIQYVERLKIIQVRVCDALILQCRTQLNMCHTCSLPVSELSPVIY
jgi:hypothetical protein